MDRYIYLTGPLEDPSSDLDYDATALFLRTVGYTVVNPMADRRHQRGETWERSLSLNLLIMIEAIREHGADLAIVDSVRNGKGMGFEIAVAGLLGAVAKPARWYRDNARTLLGAGYIGQGE